MQDRPTAAELLRAAREFCERDLVPQLGGRLRFHARVLGNVLGILEREWEQEEDAMHAEWDRLSSLLAKSDPLPERPGVLREQIREWNTELAARIRAGDFDDRWDETVALVYETVVSKLAIANPRYSAPSDTSSGAT